MFNFFHFQSPENSLSKGAINKSFEDRKRQLKHECSSNKTEDGHSRDIKRQKKLNYGSSEFIPLAVSHSEISVAPNSELSLSLGCLLLLCSRLCQIKAFVHFSSLLKSLR